MWGISWLMWGYVCFVQCKGVLCVWRIMYVRCVRLDLSWVCNLHVIYALLLAQVVQVTPPHYAQHAYLHSHPAHKTTNATHARSKTARNAPKTPQQSAPNALQIMLSIYSGFVSMPDHARLTVSPACLIRLVFSVRMVMLLTRRNVRNVWCVMLVTVRLVRLRMWRLVLFVWLGILNLMVFVHHVLIQTARHAMPQLA